MQKLLIKKEGSLYSFLILSDKDDILFDSKKDYFLTSFVKSNYKYAWCAQSAASKILRKAKYHLKKTSEEIPYAIDASAEDMLINHYMKAYDDIEDMARSYDKPDERKNVNKQVTMILEELEKIKTNVEDPKDRMRIRHLIKLFNNLIRVYFKGKKIEKNAGFNEDIKRDILENYAEKACEAIQDKHSGATYKITNSSIKIGDGDGDIVEIKINEDLNVCDIKGKDDSESVFYQRYFKPIIEGIGHFYFEDCGCLCVPSKHEMPDVPANDEVCDLDVWDSKKRDSNKIKIEFKNNKWKVIQPSNNKRMAASLYTEDEYRNSLVRCVDPTVDSIYWKIGEVVDVIPRSDIVEVDVDFGRGIDVVRLSEKQIRIVR